jgi:hypothetical protein
MALDAFEPISLATLDERAELLRRVDTKYLLGQDDLAQLLGRLAGDHDVLEIDGRRRFGYRSVYFDTAGLRCFHDHVHGRRPRFKLRTRCYLDAGACQFEVKLKTEDGETDKRQTDHPADRPERLGEAARQLVDETLAEAGVAPVERMDATLSTAFGRITLAAREGGSRMTCDLDLRLARAADGREASLRDGLVLVETKSEEGHSRADDVLAELGVEPVSMSKYRTGIDLLVEPDPTGETVPLRERFAIRPGR